ncbi:MAG TPA: GAF domain-containing sensor histidine kinase [Gemmatimonadales bacterium]
MSPAPPPLPEDGESRLRRLVHAAGRIHAEHELEVVLQAVGDAAREVIGARYAALGILDPSHTTLARFIVSGMTMEEYARIGHEPTGKGVLGTLIADPKPLRLPDVAKHPDSGGFPPHHPAMRSFLGVPILSRDGPLGNLYLTEKLGGDVFTEDDEAIAVLLAAQAAVAVENATLYEDGRRLVAEVQSMQASRDRFFATINHELRNALTAVYGWSEMLLRKAGPSAPRAAREVFESAERTLALLNDLLDLSRLEAERLRPVVEHVDAAKLALDAIATVHPAAAARNVTLEAVGTNGRAACETDGQRVCQVLVNLLSNAVRHSPAGDVVVLRTDVEPSLLRYSVIDRGPGIPASEQEHIFEAFARAGTTDHQGTGLGLTLSRQLALVLGGDLAVRSSEGEGATFILTIPRRLRES